VKADRKLRKAAYMEDCTLRVPGVCNYDPETTVFAHAPSRDNGMGLKASPDYMRWGAFACSACHDFMDGRAISLLLDSSHKPQLWLDGIYETQKRLREKGLL